MKKKDEIYLALRLHSGKVSVTGVEIDMKLPEGCEGIMFVFKTKTAARKYWGKKVGLIGFELERKSKNDN